jgi:hypothetical protein
MTPQNTDGRDKRIDRIGGDTFADTFFPANHSAERKPLISRGK